MVTIDLSGKVALVVGGRRGIGGAITATLCRAGATTVFTHTGQPRYRDRVTSLVREAETAGGKIQAEICDACDAAATTDLARRVAARHQRLDVLVCNVGQNVARPAEQVTDAEWQGCLDLNLTAAFNAVRAVLPFMLAARSGRIILIGSSAVYNGGGGAIDYAAAKAGLVGMMTYLAKNYARRGILTNTVHPCLIETDLLRERYGPEQKQKLIDGVPVGRLGQPADIAGLVAYLASPWGDYICGQSILVDGGRTFY